MFFRKRIAREIRGRREVKAERDERGEKREICSVIISRDSLRGSMNTRAVIPIQHKGR